MVSTNTEAPSHEDENATEAISTRSPIPKPPNLAGRANNLPHAEKMDHPIKQDKIHHSESQEEGEKAEITLWRWNYLNCKDMANAA